MPAAWTHRGVLHSFQSKTKVRIQADHLLKSLMYIHLNVVHYSPEKLQIACCKISWKMAETALIDKAAQASSDS